MEVDNVAQMCKQEMVNVKPFQLRAEPEKAMVMLHLSTAVLEVQR